MTEYDINDPTDLDILRGQFNMYDAEEWQEYIDDGMLTVDGDRIELTRKGFLHADALLPVFFEAEHQGVRYT